MNILFRDNMIQHLHGELNAHQSLIIQLKQQVSTLEMELAKKVRVLLKEVYNFKKKTDFSLCENIIVLLNKILVIFKLLLDNYFHVVTTNSQLDNVII